MAKCSRKVCSSTATLYPVLELRVHKHHPPALVFVNLPLCASCASTTSVNDIVTDKSWAMTCESMRAAMRAVPMRDLTTIRFATADEMDAARKKIFID